MDGSRRRDNKPTRLKFQTLIKDYYNKNCPVSELSQRCKTTCTELLDNCTSYCENTEGNSCIFYHILNMIFTIQSLGTISLREVMLSFGILQPIRVRSWLHTRIIPTFIFWFKIKKKVVLITTNNAYTETHSWHNLAV